MAFTTSHIDDEVDSIDDNGDSVSANSGITIDAGGDSRTYQYDDFESNETYSTSNHANAVRHDSTDEIDVKKLVDDPTISDIRWLYRFFFGNTIVDKPINDAFKNGFEINLDIPNSVEPLLNETEFIDAYKRGEKKARRDGFALLFYVIDDTTDGLYEESTSSNYNSLEKVDVLTIDDLTVREPSGFRELLPEKYTPSDGSTLYDLIEVRETGIVVSRKDGDPNFGEPIGYLMDRRADKSGRPKFIHESRVQHLTWRGSVDGDFYKGTDVTPDGDPLATDEWGSLGEFEGDSILTPAYHLFKSLFKGDWATMQTLFRYSSPLYEVKLPERADKEDLKQARNNFRNMNAKGDAVTPFGYDIEMHETDGQLSPTDYFEPIFEQICASVEMTKSVLFGTQQGTVTGSEVDVQNYYNQVERYQNTRAESKIREFVEWMFRRDKEAVPSFSLGFEIEWNELFKPSEMDQVEILARKSQVIQEGVQSYSIKPNEARDLYEEALDEYGFDTDLDDDIELDDFSLLMELEAAQNGNMQQYPAGPEYERENAQMKPEGSGMQQGQRTNRSQSNRPDQ